MIGLLVALLACTPDAPEPPADSPDSSSEDSPSDDSPPEDSPPEDSGPEPIDWSARFDIGDAIVTTAVGGQGQAEPGVRVEEWLDAAVLSETRGILVGEGGVRIIDIDTAEVLWRTDNRRVYRMAVDGDQAVLADRTQGLQILDLSDLSDPFFTGQIWLTESYHEGVAFDGGRILVGYQEQGGLLLDTAGNELGRLPADNAFAVGLVGDRAVLTDGDELVLFDVADPATPVELDRTTMPGEGRYIDFDGTNLVVALGGQGTSVFRVEDDALIDRGLLTLPGFSADVAIDGDYAWIAAWEVVGLAWIGEDGPVMLSHESPTSSAFGLGAGFGRSVVGDWHYITTMDRVDGVAGPELVTDTGVNVTADEDVHLRFGNGGLFPLSVTLDDPPDGVTLDTSSLVVEPGGSEAVVATLPSTPDETIELTWTSDDPDESTGTTTLSLRTDREGSEHPDFTLSGFVHPSPDLVEFNLADQRGKVVFLAYFATF